MTSSPKMENSKIGIKQLDEQLNLVRARNYDILNLCKKWLKWGLGIGRIQKWHFVTGSIYAETNMHGSCGESSQ